MGYTIKTSDSYGIVLMKNHGDLFPALYAMSDGCSAIIYITSDPHLVRLFKQACVESRPATTMYETKNEYVNRFIDELFKLKGEYIGIAHKQLMKL